MAAGKEIKNKIRSIQSTRKITSAMELVAASKMKKAQERMRATRPYSDNMLSIIRQIQASSAEYTHSFMQQRPPKKAAFIIVSSDRGLCGSLNYGLFKKTLNKIEELRGNNIQSSLAVLGGKAKSFFTSAGMELVASQSQVSEKVQITEIEGVLKAMTDLYVDEKIDQLYIGFNRFVNTMTQGPTLLPVLPLPGYRQGKDEMLGGVYAPSEQIGERKYAWDYIYEPEAKDLLDKLLQRYIESILYQAIVENMACEQAARMLAMKSASDNAAEFIEELQLVYNKARQAVITQEISEIVAGAEVL